MVAYGRFLLVANGSFGSNVLKSRLFQTAPILMGENTFFCTLLREIRVPNHLSKIQISFPYAYFSGVEFEADFST
jgi:hypothetical protein